MFVGCEASNQYFESPIRTDVGCVAVIYLLKKDLRYLYVGRGKTVLIELGLPITCILSASFLQGLLETQLTN